MRVIYADSGLSNEVGHHANACRLITAALRGRGQPVTGVGWAHMQPALAQELDVRPHFRLNTYQSADNDPICGWLSGCLLAAEVFAQDLAALGPFTPHDLLYVNSVMPPQLLGVHRFLAALSEAARPHVVVELGTDPGLDLGMTDGMPMFYPRDPRVDARATLYRFVGRQIAAAATARLHIVTFDVGSSALYSQLLGVNVATLPVPHFSGQTTRPRDQARVVGVLGHQRGEKGYALMPAVAAELLDRRDDMTLLVHNAAPDAMPETQAQMRALAATQPRLELDERAAGPALWQTLLDRCDLILCPYAPEAFRAGYSAVVSEAIAHGIPLVVPSGTTLERVLGTFGDPGTRFQQHVPSAIVEAVLLALDDFDAIALRATAAARRWSETMGATRMVDAMLARVAAADMMARLEGRHAATQAVAA